MNTGLTLDPTTLRLDVLPEAVLLGVLALMALGMFFVWIAFHRVLCRRRERIGILVRFLAVAFVFVAVMNDPTTGLPCVDQPRVKRDVQAIQERFAPANIKIAWDVTFHPFSLPPNVPTDWVMRYRESGTWRLTDDAKAVLDAANPNRYLFCLVYVPAPLYATNNTPNNVIAGSAVAKYGFTNSADAAYLGNMFISSDDTVSVYVPAHEMCHILGISNHVDEAWNLMYGNRLPNTKGVTGPKRLTSEQVEIIRGSLP